MALFPQTFIDEVRSAADIVAVISDTVSLRKAGNSYKGLCPFHGEKTPSFTVNRDKGFFHCFGCGVGGDVFKFVELQDKIGFQDAARTLAQRFGVPIPELEASDDQRQTAAEREALVRIHEIAVTHYREQLESAAGARIRQYLLDERGLTAETIATLRLGYAPPGRDALRQRLLREGCSPAQLFTSGMVSKRDDGSEFDRFRNRLMIPIARETGTVVAFGGRALDADQQPKYLNSPETPIYTKSRTLYGLNHTKGDLRKARFSLIVEGYFDFAQVFQSGGLPVVATCGTALTPQQSQMLRRFAAKALLCYDPDRAGQTAAERSSELLVGEVCQVSVVKLPDGEDPDNFIQKRGREAFVGQLRTARPYLEFLLDRAAAEYDLQRDDSRREFLSKMLGVAARIPDPAARDQFADRLAHKARVTEEVVRAEIRKAAVQKQTSIEPRAELAAGQAKPAERGRIWAVVPTPDTGVAAIAELEDDDLEGLATAGILQQARSLQGWPLASLPRALVERLILGEAGLVEEISRQPAPPADPSDCVKALKKLRFDRERADV